MRVGGPRNRRRQPRRVPARHQPARSIQCGRNSAMSTDAAQRKRHVPDEGRRGGHPPIATQAAKLAPRHATGCGHVSRFGRRGATGACFMLTHEAVTNSALALHSAKYRSIRTANGLFSFWFHGPHLKPHSPALRAKRARLRHAMPLCSRSSRNAEIHPQLLSRKSSFSIVPSARKPSSGDKAPHIHGQ